MTIVVAARRLAVFECWCRKVLFVDEVVVVGAVSRLGEDGVDEGVGRDREKAGDRYLELSSLCLLCC